MGGSLVLLALTRSWRVLVVSAGITLATYALLHAFSFSWPLLLLAAPTGLWRTIGSMSLLCWHAGQAAVVLTWAVRARRRFSPGRCHSCGYDMHHSTSAVCPECGHTGA
jgi:hypothetical protein